MHVLVISGTPSDVASLEQTAKQLDANSSQIPSSNVDLTVYVLGAFESSGSSGQISQGLQSTVNQLKLLFPYTSYQLLETTLARAGVGGYSQLEGTLHAFTSQNEETNQPSRYGLNFTVGGITGSGSSATIHIINFSFNSQIQYAVKSVPNISQLGSTPMSLRTNIDIPAGKKVVVGKAGVGGSNAIFLIVEARVAD
jgi:hypothetical protein